MSSNNMINPANYYNPFAKYNYVSKTRGVFIPRETEPVLKFSNGNTQKSSSIFSDSYDAETDLMQSIHKESESNSNSGLLVFFNKLFSQN